MDRKKAMMEVEKSQEEIKNALGSPHIHALNHIFKKFVNEDQFPMEKKDMVTKCLESWQSWER
eukprot:4758244-Karenia_brevis.AAC.1